jgi:hypothetical protein
MFSLGSLFGTGTGGGTGNGHGMGAFSADIVFTGGTGIFLDAMGIWFRPEIASKFPLPKSPMRTGRS